MDIHEATRAYEAWLGGHVRLVAADLRTKHREMTRAQLPFLRATFYRWCQRWPELAPDERRAPTVLAVGDLHIENFGTWRDGEGRLVWGVNDFDEATPLPWSHDLVRLAASAHVAITSAHLRLRRREACEAILEGYRAGLEDGGRPFVLEEEHPWLREIATGELRHPVAFWKKLTGLPTERRPEPSAARALAESLPARDLPVRLARRVAGLGSLGRPRVVALAKWRGGYVAREAKAAAPSAWLWASGEGDARCRADELMAQAVRVPDPTVRLVGRWLVRRLAPHCTRLELTDLPSERDETRLLHAMGREAANVHLGTRGAGPRILRDLHRRRGRWLHELTKAFVAALDEDWKDWRAGTGGA
jgi:uncharacterized protein DUF2252